MNARLKPVRRPLPPHWVNDTHSALNRTQVTRVIEPQRACDVSEAVAQARQRDTSLAIAGGRHAMGGQQFLSGGTLLDMRRMKGVRWFDRGRALLEVEAGITWPDLIRGYFSLQGGALKSGEPMYGIRQKQTGSDRLTIGGAVAPNIQ
jgi:FAD/FMN-containing dehydrogenase